MSRKINEIRHSTPVEEIMGNPPSRIVRWGTAVFSILLLMILSASWVIKYPYMVYGNAEITTENPPAYLMARVSGKIENLFVTEGERVEKGQVLAVMESTASYQSIIWLSSIIDSIKMEDNGAVMNLALSDVLPDRPDLGELQEYYSNFRKGVLDFSNHVKVDMYRRKSEALLEEIKNIERYITRLATTENLYRERLDLEYRKYLRDSSLYAQDVISLEAVEISRQNWLKSGIELEQIRLGKVSREIEKSAKLQDAQDLLSRGVEERERLRSVMETGYLDMVARLSWWYQNYLLLAPINGRVTFNKFWGENQLVREGENILTVVPEGEINIIARVKLPVQGSGKVKAGQNVNIKLNGYPYLEFGMITGLVSSKSLVATEDGYMIDVELPDSLITFYGREIEFSQSMPGKAEIITDDMSLFERMVNPFRYLVEKNRR